MVIDVVPGIADPIELVAKVSNSQFDHASSKSMAEHRPVPLNKLPYVDQFTAFQKLVSIVESTDHLLLERLAIYCIDNLAD